MFPPLDILREYGIENVISGVHIYIPTRIF